MTMATSLEYRRGFRNGWLDARNESLNSYPLHGHSTYSSGYKAGAAAQGRGEWLQVRAECGKHTDCFYDEGHEGTCRRSDGLGLNIHGEG
jgi:hypothetical protein